MQNACMQAAVAMCDVNAARILLEALGPEKQAMEFLDFWSKNAKSDVVKRHLFWSVLFTIMYLNIYNIGIRST